MALSHRRSVRKHPAPEGALRRSTRRRCRRVGVLSESPQHQKRLFTGLAVRQLPTAPENGRPTASPLNRTSESTRTTPPPRAPSSSTATKTSTPGGFVPGELARFQGTSRSQNASTAGAGQADAHKSGRPEKLGSRPLAAHSSPAHERAGSHATRRPGGGPSRPARRPRFRRGADAG